MTSVRVQLLENESATSTFTGWPGGRGQFAVEGTFGGATVSLQVEGPNGTGISLGTDVELTAAGVANFEAPQGRIRANVAGGAPSALYATAVRF